MFILFKDIHQVSPIFEKKAAQNLYGFIGKMRKAALNNEYAWSGYPTLQQYTNVCFWAIRKMEYGFIANQFKSLEKQIDRPLRVLDVGCGVVPLNNWLASRGHDVTAFDPLHADMEFLVKNNLNGFYDTSVRYLTARGEHLPFPSRWFDVVTFVSVLEHTIPGNDQLILDEIARVLRPSGQLLMTFDVAPLQPLQEGEDGEYQNLRRFSYPFTPIAAQQLIESLTSSFKVRQTDLPRELYDLTWEDVYAFWERTQKHDNRAEKWRYYLALGVTLQRNKQPHVVSNDKVVSAYRKGQKAMEEQHNFYRYHAERRNELIHNNETGLIKLSKDLVILQKRLIKKEAIIQEKEAIIQSFRNSFFYWVVNGPFRRLSLWRVMFEYLRVTRRFFLSKLGVLVQHSPKPLEIPIGYNQTAGPEREAPVISIVTPSYNQAKFIGKTIQSVLGQGYSNLEYVVQDGKSTDRTVKILQKYRKQLSHFESRKDNGQAHAINLGFRHTHGDVMAFLNSDDILLPGALNYVANYFQKHPEVDAIYSHRVIIDEKDQEIGRWLMPQHDNQVLYWADYVPQETLFWRRQIWEKAGGNMDISFKFALDWDLLLRFQQNGAIIRRVPRFLAAFRIHEAQKTSAHINLVGSKEMQRIRKHYLGRYVTDKEVFKRIKPYLNRSIIYHKLYRLGIYKA